VILIVAGAVVDLSITAGKVPEVPAPCGELEDAFCQQERNEEFDERLDRAFELEEDFDRRATFYAAAALAAVLIGLAVALRRTERAARREIFTDLGVASVVGLGAGLILAAGGDSLIQTPTKAVLYPPLILIAVATLGTLATPRAPAKTVAAAEEPEEPRARVVVYAGFALTAAAVLVALLAFSGRGDPCVDDVPGWVETFGAVALVLAGLGALCGVACLFARRWMVALVMLSVGPVFGMLAVLATVCWN